MENASFRRFTSEQNKVSKSEVVEKVTPAADFLICADDMCQQEAQLSLTNRAMLVCKVIEVWQDFLSEYADKKFTYICYRRLIRHE